MLELLKALGLGLMILLPLVNPLATVALFLGLSQGMSRRERLRQTRLAAIYVFCIMMVAFYAGTLVMKTFGISIPGLRIAGGMIVAFIGFRMLFPQQSIEQIPEVEQKSEEMESRKTTNIAFVPLAMPGAAGPGTLALIISSASSLQSGVVHFPAWVLHSVPVMIFLITSFILWLSLQSADAIMRLIGKSGIEAFSRLMGFLLVCMGVQFVINGVMEIVTPFFPVVTQSVQ